MHIVDVEYLPSYIFAGATASCHLIGSDCVMTFPVNSIGMRFRGSAVSIVVEGKQVSVANGRLYGHDSSLLIETTPARHSHSAAGMVPVLEPGASRAI